MSEKTFWLYALISLKHDSLPGPDVRTSVNFNGQSAGVGVPWAFVHPVGTHVEDTFGGREKNWSMMTSSSADTCVHPCEDTDLRRM